MVSARDLHGLGHYRASRAEVWFDSERLSPDQDPLAWFDPANERLQAQPVTVGGRQAAWFVGLQGQQAVLRHYRRGGLVARLSHDRYIWTGVASSRSVAEFCLMRAMHARGLPVPAPIAAAVWREGLTYRAAILVERITDARTLAICADEHDWRQAGRAVAAMHIEGVWHADLNVHNILIDAQHRAWLIDFDKGRQFERLSEAKRHSNLERFHRSMRKVIPDRASSLWPAFEKAYLEAVAEETT